MPTSGWDDRNLAALRHGSLIVHGLLPASSNTTLLASAEHAGTSVYVVYKPASGERPLWDFPPSTLYLREMAAYELSVALGWPNIPPTVIRTGPHGIGAVQIFVDHDPDQHYLALDLADSDEARRIAAFDIVANNADRKSGHVLLGPDERLWAIDHGITFHAEPKLRTVIWDYAGEALPVGVAADLAEAARVLSEPAAPLSRTLAALLDPSEITALARRCRHLARLGRFPVTTSGRAIPWPPV
jgi:hypothetical protein